MYKPPQNNNRVKLIKSKFESIDIESHTSRQQAEFKQNGTRCDLNATSVLADKSKLNLTRQLSDPVKRNIKRTPAFRLDKNADKIKPFPRNATTNRSLYFESRVKQFNSALKNSCDSNENISNSVESTDNLVKRGVVAAKARNPSAEPISDNSSCGGSSKPPLIKSKSSHDFTYILTKFNKGKFSNNKESISEEIRDEKEETYIDKVIDEAANTKKDISLLYTEPIPKSLRAKPIEIKLNISSEDIHNANTLRISDCKQQPIVPISKDHDSVDGPVYLTDTLKTALQKPLPTGPAPKKPPRTFEHLSSAKCDSNLEKCTSFLHSSKETAKKPVTDTKVSTKRDPRYMLSKLEIALRNKGLKKQTPDKQDLSGDENHDNTSFKSDCSLPETPNNSSSKFLNFNCLTGLATCNSAYEKIQDVNTSFFIPYTDEPVYAEPFSFPCKPNDITTSTSDDIKKGANLRSSLYYMSTSLLCDDQKIHNMDAHQNKQTPESSSLSSFTSDLEQVDSQASTPFEEDPPSDSHSKIKHLINAFETKQGSLQERPNGNADSLSRVEDLKISLQKTLDRCFAGDTKPATDESKGAERKISMDRMISKFETYVKTMPKYRKSIVSAEDRLFYCCLIVDWNKSPQIKFKFPSNMKVPHRIEDLCYPEAASGSLDKSISAQCYSLVITNDKGERTFGYCRRVIPEGSADCLPLTYCILSKHRAPRFYMKILMELESRHGISDKMRDNLIRDFYEKKFPRPGESVKIDLTHIAQRADNGVKRKKNDNSAAEGQRADLSQVLDLTSFVHVNKVGEYGTLSHVKKKFNQSYENIFINGEDIKKSCVSPSIIVDNGKKTELILTLHHDTRYEDADLKPLHKLAPEVLLKIFASLLLERKVILISCVISKLSSCVDALQSILYPFSWPHTFIPILPQCLWDVVESPTPVVCGILNVAIVNQYTIEHGIVVDLDEGIIVSQEGDENSILSGSMKKAWYQGLALAKATPEENYVHSVYLSDAYMRVFVICMKNYKNYIADGVFDKENFIKNGKTRGIRRFLKWFTETTLFFSFIDSVTNDPQSFTIFDKKIEIYGSDDSQLILNKLLEWKK